MDYLNDLVSEVTEKFSYELEQVIKGKLLELRDIALNEKEFKLYKILANINIPISDAKSIKNRLQLNGYELCLERPETSNVKIDGDGISMTYDISQVKLKVKKVIFEV